MSWQLFAQNHGKVCSSTCSNYFPEGVAACLHCTTQTEPCTGYVMILHVPLLSHNDIYSFFLSSSNQSLHRTKNFLFFPPEIVYSDATPDTTGKYAYSTQIPQYSHLTECNIFNTKRRMGLREK